MTKENQHITFDVFVENAQTIFDSFPNEQVWLQGGFRPNRQRQTPEAGYCIVLRYDEKITSAIWHFMTKIRSVLPYLVEYNEQNLHTTIGTYGKRDMKGFVPNSVILQHLMESLEKGINNYSQNICIEFRKWLYNEEAILVSGYPNQDLWDLCQNIGNTFQENGFPLEMRRIIHITTARFTSSISSQEFEKFRFLMKSVPVLETTKPLAIDLAIWRCDGLEFDLVTYKRYIL